ncbi:MAG: ABC transporter ATP-binding protein, partial [Clostridia bacterium]
MSVGMGGGVGDRNVTRNMSNKRKPKNVKRTLSRMFAYLKPHKVKLILVVVFILFSALANVVGASFISTLIDKYILPMTKIENPNFAPLIGALALMAGFYLTGAAATYIYNRIMVDITNISLQKIRNELFEHMQKLPIKYYDTHTHGELMSRYTNDIDAMRQMLSQGFPQLLSSSITVVGVFVAMLLQSPLLMVLVIVMLFVMLKTVSILKKKSGKHFINMQTSLGKVNGKVEEMISGQKVVKVFCHEKEAVKDFDVLNDELAATGTSAHSYSNVLMPIMGNLSYLHYALTAMSGGLMLAFSITNLTIGKLGSFLQLTRQFSQPITQLSQLFMAVMTALAGAERVFEMLDENQEIDEGNITLVNVTMDNNGILAQSKERTGIWAWKIPDIGDYNNDANNDNCNIDNHNNDNNYKFTLLKGDVRFSDVTFSYEKEKAVLKNLSLYAKPGQKIAFVGSTGAGKTTITNLINRFYDVDNGAITYDGIDVRRIKKDDLRRSLAIVLQDTHL